MSSLLLPRGILVIFRVILDLHRICSLTSIGVFVCDEIEVAVHRDVILAVKGSGDTQRLGFGLLAFIGVGLLVDEVPVLGSDILVVFVWQAVHVVL